MAPNLADTAAAPQRQARRSVPRIIPAIPHRFSRPAPAARPVTPDDSTSAAVTQREPEPQPQPQPQPAPEKDSHEAVETPPTPDSRAFAVTNGEVEETGLASSPALSGDDHIDEALGIQGLSPPTIYNDRVFQASGSDLIIGTSEEFDNQSAPHEAPLTPQPKPERSAINGDRPKAAAPAELPPEFHPREKPASNTPTAENGEVSTSAPPNNVPIHRPQPSVETLVFGGTVPESPTKPSTPQELDPDTLPPQQAISRPPGFAPPHLAPQFYPGHSHHPSDPAAPWLYPAYSMAPHPDGIYTNGNDYHSPSFPTGAVPYQPPFPAQFSPRAVSLAIDGTTRSHSQSPSKSQFGEAKPASTYDEDHPSAPYGNGNVSANFEAAPDGYDITKHIFSQFGNLEFTDYILHIRSQDILLLSLPVHAAVVSRSPVILEALRRTARAKDPRRLADILSNDIFVTPESLHEAVKVLYAAPLLPVRSFLYGLGPYDGSGEGYTFNDARKRMTQVISYAAAGRVLQIPEMQTCGLHIAKALLRWDTLDQVLHFGFSASKTTVEPSGVGADNRLLETYAVPLLDDAIEFIAYNFPVDFKVHTIAPELRQNPRLPTVVEFRQPTHNPRLSKIRFGDAPPEDDLKPSHVTQILSSTLLSLPLPLLDRLFSHPAAANHVGWSGLVRTMRDVVDERERRRQKALQMKSSLESTIPRSLVENLYTEERVEAAPERPSGFKLTANRLSDQT